MHIIEICVEFLVILSISILLFLSEPKGFLFISLFYSINIFLFLFLSRSFLGKLGKDRMSFEAKRLMSIQQGLSIIQEIEEEEGDWLWRFAAMDYKFMINDNMDIIA